MTKFAITIRNRVSNVKTFMMKTHPKDSAVKGINKYKVKEGSKPKTCCTHNPYTLFDFLVGQIESKPSSEYESSNVNYYRIDRSASQNTYIKLTWTVFKTDSEMPYCADDGSVTVYTGYVIYIYKKTLSCCHSKTIK